MEEYLHNHSGNVRPYEAVYGGTYGQVELVNVFAVTRDAPLAEEIGKRLLLLWHGTNVTNILIILQKGLHAERGGLFSEKM